VRPARRITCIRVPQGPLDPPPATVEAAASHAAVAVDLPERPVPPFWFEDVLAPNGPGLISAPEPEVQPEPEPLPAAAAPLPAPEPEPLPAAAAPLPEPEPEPLPAAAAPLPAPEPEPEVQPEPEPALAVAAPPAPAPQPIPVTAAATVGRQEPSRTWGWAEPWSFEVPTADLPSRRGTAKNGSRGTFPRPRAHSEWLRPMVAFAALVLAVSIWIAAPWSPSASARPAAARAFTPHPSVFALRTIPAAYLHDYWRAAEEYGLDWTKLAAVGQLESDQGRSQIQGVSQGTNTAGAAGPAQFLGSTWARFGVDADGRGTINPYDPADAITAMAAYLKASGAPQNWRQALYAYNHSTAYVNAVISLSRLYLAPPPTRG